MIASIRDRLLHSPAMQRHRENATGFRHATTSGRHATSKPLAVSVAGARARSSGVDVRPGPTLAPAAFPSVSDVLSMDVVRFALPRVVSGGAGLDRRVRWVHVGEICEIAEYLAGGELVLTTGVARRPTAQDCRGTWPLSTMRARPGLS